MTDLGEYGWMFVFYFRGDPRERLSLTKSLRSRGCGYTVRATGRRRSNYRVIAVLQPDIRTWEILSKRAGRSVSGHLYPEHLPPSREQPSRTCARLGFRSCLSCCRSKVVEWPAKRCYVGLVAVGVQEQAEDILVPPLLRNCLTLNDISFS